MVGIVKLLSLVATCLLFFDGLQELDWESLLVGANVKPALELVLQGKEILFSILEGVPWLARAVEKSMQIEFAVSGIGIGLAMAGRFSFFEFVSKLVLMAVVLSATFALIVPNRQVIVDTMRSLNASQSWCMGLVSQIEARQRIKQQEKLA